MNKEYQLMEAESALRRMVKGKLEIMYPGLDKLSYAEQEALTHKHYEELLDEAVNEAKEEARRFLEAFNKPQGEK